MRGYEKDTIAAVGTRPGEAAIGIVKLSGTNSIKVVDKCFRAKSKKKLSEIDTFTMLYGELIDSDKNPVDEVLVSIMKKPKSYTREDVVEINCHGGMVPTCKILDICISNGARIAEPGEFTKRAFLNGRIDLSQAEAVIDLVRSKTEKSLKVAAKNIKGEIKREINKIKNLITEILVQLEASVDFIEEDLELTPHEELTIKVIAIKKEVEELIRNQRRGEIVKNGVKMAIVGKPNVGKSSILNAISKKEKAIVTSFPGTTRDAVEEIIYVEGIPLILVDTAGIRKAKNEIEKIGVSRSLKHIDEAEIIIFVIDGSYRIEKLDFEIMDRIKDKKVIICINKIDLEQKIEKEIIGKYLKGNTVIEVSALKGNGIERLEKRILSMIIDDGDFNLEEKIIINSRHKNILIEVNNLLENAVYAMRNKMSEEFPSSDLKIANNLLGEIIGETARDDVLDRIFSQFCIGK